MSIYGLKKILAVGKGTDLRGFVEAFENAGIDVVAKDNFRTALSVAQEVNPDAVLFVLPRYWSKITEFVEEFRKIEEFEKTPIVYVGSMIQGVDQQILKEKGVHTLTMGPVPVKEMARYVMEELNKF